MALAAGRTSRRRGVRLIHDPPDGAGATAAFRIAPEAAVNFTGAAHIVLGRDGPHLMIRNDVARAHDHG